MTDLYSDKVSRDKADPDPSEKLPNFSDDPDPHRHEDRDRLLFRASAEVYIYADSEDEALDLLTNAMDTVSAQVPDADRTFEVIPVYSFKR